MRSKTAIWFECKIRYEKTMEDGLLKKVNEVYVIDALSFSEAEERITKEMSSYISGEFEIVDVKIAEKCSLLMIILPTNGSRQSYRSLQLTNAATRKNVHR